MVKRKQIARIYSVLVFILCIYVPWGWFGANGHRDHGYSFVWDPPQISSQVDKARLIIPLVGLTALFGVAWYQSKE